MEALKSNELYSLEWFKNRAFKSLKKLGEGVWDFSDSLLLYAPGTEEEYEAVQQVESPYHKLVTQPEREYLEGIASTLVSELPSEFEYIDLGPGTEHKEQFIFDAAKQQNKKFTYAPVDISEKFLAQSSGYASQQNISTHPYRVPFEELPARLKSMGVPRFVLLGLTYSNYEPQAILDLLKILAGEEGFVFINSQIRDRVNMDEIKKIYKDNVYGMSKSKLQLLGLDIETDVSEIATDDGVRVWCTLKRSTPELERLGMVAGARLLAFQSLRTTKESLEKDIAAIFPEHKLFDTEAPFIGALLKNTG